MRYCSAEDANISEAEAHASLNPSGCFGGNALVMIDTHSICSIGRRHSHRWLSLPRVH